MNTIYSLSGLTYGQHSITLEVLEGTLSVDMVGILGNRYQTPPPPTAEPPAPETPTPPAGNPHASAAPAPQTSSPAIQTPSLNAGLKKGTIVTAGKAKYEITDPAKKEAAYKKPLNTQITTANIPAAVKLTENEKKVAYKVTSIRSRAFVDCKRLKSLVVGKNIKTIGKEACKGCRSLKKIKLQSCVLKQVGRNAYRGIYKKATITCNKKVLRAYRKLFTAKTGITPAIKLKKS